jgi:hypothetical protein
VALALNLGLSVEACGLPIYAARESISCQSCHVDPSGGGMRNAFGFDYMLSRHSMTPEFKWENLPETQPEVVPGLTFGSDLRAIYTALHHRDSGDFPSQQSTFIRMQSGLYVNYAPLDMFNIYLNIDVDQQSLGGPEWYGVARVLPARGYVRFGAFRIPYGLRMDDHTIRVRADLRGTVLPAGFNLLGRGGDPRSPDTGLEFGWVRKHEFVQLAVTNGSGGARDREDRNVAFTARGGGFLGPLILGVTTHLDTDGGDSGTRATEVRRYGAYGGLRLLPDLVLLGELNFAEDVAGGAKTRQVLHWAEADYFVRRDARLRFRYDFLDVDRDVDERAAERFTIEADLTPIPFASFRTSYRYTRSEFTNDLDEIVVLGHFHF